MNYYKLHKGAMTFWLLALITNLVAIIRILITNYIALHKIRNNPTKKQDMKILRK